MIKRLGIYASGATFLKANFALIDRVTRTRNASTLTGCRHYVLWHSHRRQSHCGRPYKHLLQPSTLDHSLRIQKALFGLDGVQQL